MKTWSREVATALLFFLCYLALYDQLEALKILVAPFMTFIVPAFLAKQESVKALMERFNKNDAAK